LRPALAARIASGFASRLLAGLWFTGLRLAGIAAALFGEELFQNFFPHRFAAGRFARITCLGFRHSALDRFASLAGIPTRITTLLLEQFLQADQQVVSGLAAHITCVASRFTRLGFWYSTFDRRPARVAAGAAFQAP